jgi:hypothetical protein
MSGIVNIPLDHDCRVPLVWQGGAGLIAVPPTAATTATSDNVAIATVAVAADNASIVVASVAAGSCNVTAVNGSMRDSIAVNVTASAITGLVISANNAELVAKGTVAREEAPTAPKQSERHETRSTHR